MRGTLRALLVLVAMIHSGPTWAKTKSQENCAKLLQSESNLQLRLMKEVESFTDFFSKTVRLPSDSSPELKEEYYQSFQAQVSQISKLAEEKLIEEGIEFETVDRVFEWQDYEIPWKGYQLKPVAKGRYNSLAKRLFDKLGVSLVYDPLLNVMNSSHGAYSPKNRTIYMSIVSLNQWPIDPSLGHEIIHAHLAAHRKQNLDFGAKAPVHIWFSADESINPEILSQSYTKQQSYEELVTFAHSIQGNALALLKSTSLEERSLHQAHLDRNMVHMMGVAENVVISAQRALVLMITGGEIDLVERDGSFYYVIAKSDESFRVVSFVPKEVAARGKNEAQKYTMAELGRAWALAKFILDYFPEASARASRMIDPHKAYHFKTFQKKFIQDLPMGHQMIQKQKPHPQDEVFGLRRWIRKITRGEG